MTTKENTKRYYEGIGRRKTSVARVRITEASKNSFVINEKESTDYFPTDTLRKIAHEALDLVPGKFLVTVHVNGGGISSQSVAIRHGMARALVAYDLEKRTDLKKAGFLKRDPRAKERRKFGLKKARKAPQWSKR